MHFIDVAFINTWYSALHCFALMHLMDMHLLNALYLLKIVVFLWYKYGFCLGLDFIERYIAFFVLFVVIIDVV